MFIDSVKIFVKAGNGGRGCNSRYRDRYNRLGTPDGGNGGKGADIIIRADRNLATLLDLRYKKHFYGDHGGHGSGKFKKGRDAKPIIIRVPLGTVITEFGTGCVLRELDKDQDELIVAEGGKGGIGNRPFKDATPGEETQGKELVLDLKILADVGVIGFPNAGKSTLINALSNATSKVGAYPFTTKFPILGAVSYGSKKFVMADIPGLIKGSSEGRGLGDKFLRHIERTKVLVHIIDMSGIEGRSPIEDYKTINKELKNYSTLLTKKNQIVVANKMDIDSSFENLNKFKAVIRKKIYPISALKKEGLEELVKGICKKI